MANGIQAPSESPAGSWLVLTLTRLNELARLQANWDGYGSPAVQRAALQTAIRLLLELAPDEPAEPQIIPVPGGGVQLEWQTASRELELEILPQGTVEYLRVEGEHTKEGELPPNRIGEVRHLVRWLRSSKQ